MEKVLTLQKARIHYSLKAAWLHFVRIFFYQHLTEDRIQSNILDTSPVPADAFCMTSKVDEFVKDFIDFNAMTFLKMQDKSLAFIQKKIAQITGPLVKIWQAVDGARKGQEENSVFTVLKHAETGRTNNCFIRSSNATCLHERHVNFLAKVMKGVKKAKEHLKTNELDLSKEKEVFYGGIVLGLLTVKAKVGKEPERSLKKCNQKGVA